MVFKYSVQLFEYLFWEILPLSVQEIVSLYGHWTFLDTGTVHDQFEVQKVRSGISINYLELGSLYKLNCFLTSCNSRRRLSICKFKF